MVGYPKSITSQTEAERLRGGATPGDYREFEYDNVGVPLHGLVTKITRYRSDPFASYIPASEKWAYDAVGNVTGYWNAFADPAGTPTTTTEYDDVFHSFPVSIENLYGHKTEFLVHDQFAEVERVLDANGYLRCTDYDAFGRLQSVRDAEAPRSNLLQGICGRTVSSHSFVELGDPYSQRIESIEFGEAGTQLVEHRRFDGLGRVYSAISQVENSVPRFRVNLTGWDSRGHRSCSSFPFFVTSPHDALAAGACADLPVGTAPHRHYERDELGRLIGVGTASSGGDLDERIIEYSIDDHDGVGGNEVVETETVVGTPSVDRVLERGFDARKKVVSTAYAGEPKTVVTRDAKGRVVAIDGPDVGVDENRIELAYDTAGNRVRFIQVLPGGTNREWAYRFSAMGDVEHEQRPDGAETFFRFDALGRQIMRDAEPFNPSGLPGIEDTVYIYDEGRLGARLGALVGIVTPGSRAENQWSDGMMPYSTIEKDYAYDLFGNQTLKRVGYISADPSVTKTVRYTIATEYDALHRTVRTVYPDLTSVSRVYDGRNLSTTLRHQVSRFTEQVLLRFAVQVG